MAKLLTLLACSWLLPLLATAQPVGPLATFMLSQFAGRVQSSGVPYYPNYPQTVCMTRANVRTVQGNFCGAEADLTQAP